MIEFEITICEKCNKSCYCDYCNLPGYDDRRIIEFNELTLFNIKMLNDIVKKLKDNYIEINLTLGGIGEPGLVDINKMGIIFKILSFDTVSTTGAFLERDYHIIYGNKYKKLYLHVAEKIDEELISKYENYIDKAWTILSNTKELNEYNLNLYNPDNIYPEADLKGGMGEMHPLIMNYFFSKFNFNDIIKDRIACLRYMKNIVINLTRNTISLCSCYNSFIEIDLNFINLKKVLTRFDPFKDVIRNENLKCKNCFRNCLNLSKIDIKEEIKLKRRLLKLI